MNGLRTKLLVGFGGLLGVLLVVSATSLFVLTRYSNTLQQLYHDNYDSVRFCDRMKQSLENLNTQAMNLLWEDVPTSRRADRTEFETNLEAELANTTLPGEAIRAHEVATAWRQYSATWQRFESARANERDALYRAQMLSQFERIKDLIQQISDMNMANMMSVDGQVKRTLTDVRDVILVLVLAGTMISSALVAGVGASILRSVRSLTRSAREIEGGNLDLRVEVNSQDEIGQLAQAFNSMAVKLREFRKSDHERLIRSQLTTQLAIDSLPDAVFLIDPHGEIEISNRTAERHFGIAPGVALANLNLPWLADLYAQVLADKHALDPEGYRGAIQLFENQQERFLLPRAVPMLADDGSILGVTVILVDVTRLRHADEIKSSLVSTVSHELRTPLTSIRMGVLMLNEEKLGPLTPRQRKSLAAVRDDSDRLHRIIENLLSIGRIEAGGDRLRTRHMTADEIANLAVESIRGSLEEKNARLSITVPHDLPEVLADPSCIEVALANLLSNAVKFSPRGGDVSLTVQLDGDSLRFDVTDHGPGIAAEHMPHIFERFYRIPQKDGPSGAGLGLAISKEIVESHRGRIWLSSGTSGCTFSFTLPCTAPAAVPA